MERLWAGRQAGAAGKHASARSKPYSVSGETRSTAARARESAAGYLHVGLVGERMSLDGAPHGLDADPVEARGPPPGGEALPLVGASAGDARGRPGYGLLLYSRKPARSSPLRPTLPPATSSSPANLGKRA